MSETSKEIPEIIYPFVSVSQRAREVSGKPSLLEHTSTACRQRFRASSGVRSHTLKQCHCRTEPRRALIPEAPRQALPTCTRREGQPDARHHGRRHPGRGLRAGCTVGSGLGTSRPGHGDGGRRWCRHRPCRTAEPLRSLRVERAAGSQHRHRGRQPENTPAKRTGVHPDHQRTDTEVRAVGRR